jgi:hypothetical protein
MFHKHLDICIRCRENIFSLCPVGEHLLRLEGTFALRGIYLK